MEKSLYSSSWYRVADLKPRLRSHVRFHRRQYRKQLWYVLQDRTSGRYHRFTPSAYLIINLMNGDRTVQEIWDLACVQLDEDTVTQDGMIRLLSQLHSGNVLCGDAPPDLEEMANRGDRLTRKKLLMSVMNPLSLRIPLMDPEVFVSATYPLIKPFLSWFGALVFLFTVGYALMLAGQHWSELTGNIADQVLVAESLLLLVLTYPFVKALHELGHAYAVKKWGGEVHEIGIMFLVFMPVPYVDASESAGFQSKWQRAFVGAAGIIVEVFLAALAMFVWLNAEEGLVKAFAFNVMLIGGVSTVLFNGNPLLRFDGYYVLSDLLEIPNLGMRANRYIAYLIQHYLFGVESVESPVTAKGEAGWFFFYAIASFVYRLFIVVAIITFVGTQFFIIGVILAIWSLILMFVVPLSKQLWFLLTSPVLRRKRGRAMSVTLSTVAFVAGVLMFVPLPYATMTEGVVWAPEESDVRAGADGQIAKVLSEPSTFVKKGTPLFQAQDPLLDARVRVLQAKVRELELSYEATDFTEPVQARIIAEKLKHAKADLELAYSKREALIVRSHLDGVFLVSQVADLPGEFVKKGDTLGYVMPAQEPVIRVVVTEDQADLVRRRLQGIDIRFVEDIDTVIEAKKLQEVPTLTNSLPTLALSTAGGGKNVVDPTAKQDLRVLENLLHLEISVDLPPKNMIGGRVYVRFDHGNEALASRIYRSVRQVFLKTFNV